MEDFDAKKLRDSLVEYESHLSEMRQVTLKNVETLDVIQRYTDKSAVGMQKLTEQSLDGIQKVTAESAAGLRRMIETGTSNVKQMAESGEASVERITDAGVDSILRTAQECLEKLQNFTETGLSRIDAATEKNLEAAAAVEKMEKAVSEHMNAVKELIKQSDEFTHKENVRVYRNVQAAVVEEGKKQAEALAAQNEELAKHNEELKQQMKSLRPLVIVTLAASLVNIGLMAARIAGVF